MNGWFVAGGTVAIGVIVGLWSQICGVWAQLRAHAVGSFNVHGGGAYAVMYYVHSMYKRSKFGLRTYAAYWRHNPRTDSQALFPFELLSGSSVIFWRGWCPILVCRIEMSNSAYPPINFYEPAYGVSITYLRGTIDPDKFVIAAIDEVQKLQSSENMPNRYRLVTVSGTSDVHSSHSSKNQAPPSESENRLDTFAGRPVGFSLATLFGMSNPNASLDALSLSPEMEQVVTEVNMWLRNKVWYCKRNVPWRRGYLFTGRPGTGKTSLTRALGESFGLPIFSYDLATLRNVELRERWSDMLSQTPAIALIEDIDAVFDKDKNTTNTGLTFDCLLNCIDGIRRANGLLLIVTTNNENRVSPALCIAPHGQVSRPGRIDRIIQFDMLSTAGRHKICKRILVGYEELWEAVIREGDADTGAQFQERCIQKALQQFWAVETSESSDSFHHIPSGNSHGVLARNAG